MIYIIMSYYVILYIILAGVDFIYIGLISNFMSGCVAPLLVHNVDGFDFNRKALERKQREISGLLCLQLINIKNQL